MLFPALLPRFRSFRRFAQPVVGGLTAVVFLFGVVFAPVAEANFWQERRRTAVERRSDFAALPLASARLPSGTPLLPEKTASLSPMHSPVPVRSAEFLPESVRSIPPQWARVESVRPGAPEKPWIVVMQDMHDVISAQSRIGQTLAHLSAGSSLLVGMEGASGPFILDRYRLLPDAETRRHVADYLLSSNLINGPEHAGLTAERAPELWGVETPELYAANARAYREGLAVREKLAARLARVRRVLAEASEKRFSSALMRLHRQEDDYRAGHLALADYLRSLWHAAGHTGPEPIRLFARAAELESSLDFKKVEQDREELIRRLTETLPSRELKRLLELSLAHRMNELSFADYYAALRRTASEAGCDPAAFESFDRYADYVMLAEKIDDKKLFDELAGFESAVKDRLARTPTDHRLNELWADLRLSERMAGNALAFSEWRRYGERRDAVRNLENRLGEFGAPERHDEPLAVLLRPFETFYETAAARGQRMVDNLLERLSHPPSGGVSAVLMAGGFHTPDIADRLRENGVSVVVLTPRLEKVEGTGTDYLDVFGGESSLERALLGDRLFLAPPSALAARNLLGDRRNETVKTLTAFLYTALEEIQAGASDTEARDHVRTALGTDLSLRRKLRSPTGGWTWEFAKRDGGRTVIYRLLMEPADSASADGYDSLAGENDAAVLRGTAGSYRFALFRLSGQDRDPSPLSRYASFQSRLRDNSQTEEPADIQRHAIAFHESLNESEPWIQDDGWVTESFVSSDGTLLAADVRPALTEEGKAKPPVFLFHGWAAPTSFNWQKVPDFLKDRTVVVPFRRGYLPSLGGVEAKGDRLSVYAEDMAAAINRWGSNGAIVIAHSMGSQQLQHFYLSRSDEARTARNNIRGLVFYSPSVGGIVRDIPPFLGGGVLPAFMGPVVVATVRVQSAFLRAIVIPLLKRFKPSWQGPFLRMNLALIGFHYLRGMDKAQKEYLFSQLWRTTPEHVLSEMLAQSETTAETMERAADEIRKAGAPAYVLEGQGDWLIPTRTINRLTKALGIEGTGRIVRLSDKNMKHAGAHMSMMTAPDKVADALQRIVDQIDSFPPSIGTPERSALKGQPVSTHGAGQVLKAARATKKVGRKAVLGFIVSATAVLAGFADPFLLLPVAAVLTLVTAAARTWRTKALFRFEPLVERAGPVFLERGRIEDLSDEQSRALLERGVLARKDGELRLDSERLGVLNAFRERTGFDVRFMSTGQLTGRFGENRLMETVPSEKTLYVNAGVVRAPPESPVTAENITTLEDETLSFNLIFTVSSDHLKRSRLQIDPSAGSLARFLGLFLSADRVNYYLHSYNAAVLYIVAALQDPLREGLALRGTERDGDSPSFPQEMDELLERIKPLLETNWLNDIPPDETPTALVTGGSGYAAPWMIRALSEYNRMAREGRLRNPDGRSPREIRIVATDLPAEWHPRLRELFPDVAYVGKAPFDADSTYERLSRDPSGRPVKYHMIFDFGGVVGNKESDDPRMRDLAYRANVDGKKKLFEWASAQGALGIYHVSTAAVYKPADRRLVESDPLESNATYEDYGLSKIIGEELLWETYQKSRSEGGALRHVAVFRPGSLTGEYIQSGHVNRGLAQALKILYDGFFVGLPKNDPEMTNIDLRDTAAAMLAVVLSPAELPDEPPPHKSKSDYTFNLAETPFRITRALMSVVRTFPVMHFIGARKPRLARLFGVGGPLNPRVNAGSIIGAVRAAGTVEKLVKLLTLQPAGEGLPEWRIRQAFDTSAFSPEKLRATLVRAMKDRGHDVSWTDLPPFDRTIVEGGDLMKRIDESGWAGFEEGPSPILSPLQEKLREKAAAFRRAQEWLDALDTYRRSGEDRTDLAASLPDFTPENFSIGPLDAKTLDLLLTHRLHRMPVSEKWRLHAKSFPNFLFFSLHRVFEPGLPVSVRLKRWVGWMAVVLNPLFRRRTQEHVWIYQSMSWIKENAGLIGGFLQRFPADKPYFRLIQTPDGFIGVEILRAGQSKPRIRLHRAELDSILPDPAVSLKEAVERVAEHFDYAESGGVVTGVSAERFSAAGRADHPLRGLLFGAEFDFLSAAGSPAAAAGRLHPEPQESSAGWILFTAGDSLRPVFGVDVTGPAPRWMDPEEFAAVDRMIGSGLFIRSEIEDGRLARTLERVGVSLRPMDRLPETFARLLDRADEPAKDRARDRSTLRFLNRLHDRSSPRRFVSGKDDALISYRVSGSADSRRTLVVLPGWRGKGDDWAAQRDALQADYRVVTVDLRGHGGSALGQSTPETYLSDAADDALRILDAEGIRDNVTLAGHGLGGKVALRLAETAEPGLLDSFVFFSLNTAFDGRDLFHPSDGPPRLSRFIVRLLGHRFVRSVSRIAFGRLWKSWSGGMSPAALLVSREADITSDVREELSRLDLPMSWVESENDGETPPFRSDAVLRRKSNVRAVFLRATGARPHREKPYAVARILADHLASLDRPDDWKRDAPGFEREMAGTEDPLHERAAFVRERMDGLMDLLEKNMSRWRMGSLRRFIQGTWQKRFAEMLAGQYGMEAAAHHLGLDVERAGRNWILDPARRWMVRTGFLAAGAVVAWTAVTSGNVLFLVGGTWLLAVLLPAASHQLRRLFWLAADVRRAKRFSALGAGGKGAARTGDLADDLNRRLDHAARRHESIVPRVRRPLTEWDENARALVDRFDGNLSYIAAAAALSGEWPDTSEIGVSPQDFRRFHDLLEKVSVKLLPAREIDDRRARLLRSLHRRFERIRYQYERSAKEAAVNYADNAAHSALLLGALAAESAAHGDMLKPWITRDLLVLRELLSQESSRPRHAGALARLMGLAAAHGSPPPGADGKAPVYQVADVFGEAFDSPGYMDAVIRLAEPNGAGTSPPQTTLILTDDESRLRERLAERPSLTAPLGRDVFILPARSLPPDAIRRDESGEVTWIDVSKVPNAVKGLASRWERERRRVRILTRRPAIWWLGGLPEGERRSMVEFILWVTRDLALTLPAAGIEEYLRAKKVLEIQA